MIIYLVGAEPEEEAFLVRNLEGQDVRTVSTLAGVDADAEIVSVFLGMGVDAAFLESHPHLKLVATRSHSTEHIDLAACSARGVDVRFLGPYGIESVAEHTMALMLALARRLREVMCASPPTPFSYEATRGMDLCGRTLGIIGLGRIGRRVAELARAFGMTVLATDPAPAPGGDADCGVHMLPFAELLGSADILTLHASLNEGTFHLLNRETFALCRPGTLLVNTARGALIDLQALREALDSGRIGGAGLDVLEDERVMRESVPAILGADIVRRLRSDALAGEARDAGRLQELRRLILCDAVLSRPNVVFTPHVAFNSDASDRFRQELSLKILQSFLQGRPSDPTHAASPLAPLCLDVSTHH